MATKRFPYLFAWCTLICDKICFNQYGPRGGGPKEKGATKAPDQDRFGAKGAQKFRKTSVPPPKDTLR